MDKPLITAGITAYNAELTIERAVLNALSQSCQSLEVLVVDDFSTDRTKHVLLKLQKQFNNVRVVFNSANQGVAASRNVLIEHSKGEFIAFFDDDDISDPQRIAKQLKRLVDYEERFAEGHPVLCHTARVIMYPNGNVKIQKSIGNRLESKGPSGMAVAERILLGRGLDDGNGSCATCSQFGRLSTFKGIGGFDVQFRRSEDTDFVVRLAEAGGHFVGVAEPLVFQTMTKTNDKSLKGEHFYWQLLLKKHQSKIGSARMFRFVLAWSNVKQSWLERAYPTFIWRFFILLFTSPVLTTKRLYSSLQNLSVNNEFRKFHKPM